MNWYTNFDTPIRGSDQRWWIGVDSGGRPTRNLGSVRGGHAICIHTPTLKDQMYWYEFYDQGSTGECVGYSCTRMMTLVNRRRYLAEWLYLRATETDEWPDNDDDPQAGTSVRAGLEVLRTEGHLRVIAGAQPDMAEGISAYRWATSPDEVHGFIKSPLADQLGAIPLLQSWGRYYPHMVWMPDEVLDRMLQEGGEIATFTDR